MAQRNVQLIAAVTALGAGTVLAVVLLFTLQKPERAPDPPGPAETQVAAGAGRTSELGVGRIDFDPAAGDEPPVRLSDVRPEIDPNLLAEVQRRGGTPPDPPLVDTPLDPETQVEEDAAAALRARVAADVQKQLDRQRAALKKACWKPGLTNGASAASYAVNASFDPGGKLVGVGISDVRGEGDGPSSVGQCLRQQVFALDIPAPGTSVTVDVPLRLP